MRTRTLHVARSAALLAGAIIAFPSHAASVSAIWEASGLENSDLGLDNALLTIEVIYDTGTDAFYTDPDEPQEFYLPDQVLVTIDDGSSVYNWSQSSFDSSELGVINNNDDIVGFSLEEDEKADQIYYHARGETFSETSDTTLNGYSLFEVFGSSAASLVGDEGGPFMSTALPDAGLTTDDFELFGMRINFREALNN